MLTTPPHSLDQFLTHFEYRVRKLQGMIINSASKLLQICIQLICKSIVKLADLYSLSQEADCLYRSKISTINNTNRQHTERSNPLSPASNGKLDNFWFLKLRTDVPIDCTGNCNSSGLRPLNKRIRVIEALGPSSLEKQFSTKIDKFDSIKQKKIPRSPT